MWRSIFSSQTRPQATHTNTVDNEELQYFETFVETWWNERGPVKVLHAMNKLRVPMIKDGLIDSGTLDPTRNGSASPLKDLSILDVGCGAGILSESLAKCGANITGIDASIDLIQQAKCHAKLNNLNIKYVSSPIEEYALEHCEIHDAVIISEVLEHVSMKKPFLEACIKCLKPRGSLFITTINKTALARFWVIFMYENIFNWIPKGTHQYEKFIEPSEVQKILKNYNCETRFIRGWLYNGFSNSWHWTTNTSMFYVLHAIKLKTE